MLKKFEHVSFTFQDGIDIMVGMTDAQAIKMAKNLGFKDNLEIEVC